MRIRRVINLRFQCNEQIILTITIKNLCRRFGRHHLHSRNPSGDIKHVKGTARIGHYHYRKNDGEQINYHRGAKIGAVAIFQQPNRFSPHQS